MSWVDVADLPLVTDVDSQTATAILDPESETSAALAGTFVTEDAAVASFAPIDILDRSIPLLEQISEWSAADGAGFTSGPDWRFSAGYGSSTMNGMTSRMSALAAASSATYIDGSGSGQSVEHIAARLGSRPLQVGGFVNIPMTGSVVVPSSNVSSSTNAAVSYRGHFEGNPERPGVLSKAAGAQPGFVFTPNNDGAEITLALGTKFVPEFAATHRDVPIDINMGKNNLTGVTGGTSDLETVITMTIEAANFMLAKGHPIFVWGHYVDSDEPAASPVRDKIMAYNARMKARYGTRFIDLWALVTSFDVWAKAGISPTADDLAAQAIGNKPPSLSGDLLHLNTAGNNVLRDLVAQHHASAGWFPAGVNLAGSLVACWIGDDQDGADAANAVAWASREGSVTGLTLTPSGTPKVKAHGLNAHKTVVLTAANGDAFNTPAASLSLPVATYVLIFRITGTTGAAQSIFSGAGSGYHRMYTRSEGSFGLMSASTTNEISLSAITAPGNWIIAVAIFNGADSSLSSNGNILQGVTSAATQTMLRLGVNAGGTSSRANIEIAGLAIYNKALSEDERAAATQALVDLVA